MVEKLFRLRSFIAAVEEVFATGFDMEDLVVGRMSSRDFVADLVVDPPISFYQHEVAAPLEHVEDLCSV